MPSENSAYTILGLPKGASDKEVKNAYVHLVKKYDPEKHTDRFMVIQQAYDRLRDPKLRAREDVFTYNLAMGEYLFQEDEKWKDDEAQPEDSHIEKLRADYLEDPMNDQGKRNFCRELFRRAHYFVRRKQFSDAIRDWGEILEHEPSHSRARHNLELACASLGISYALHGLHEESVELIERALQLNPDNTSLMHNLALISEHARDANRTLYYWEEVINRWKAKLNRDKDNEYLRQCILEALSHQADLNEEPWTRKARMEAQEEHAGEGETPASQRPSSSAVEMPSRQDVQKPAGEQSSGEVRRTAPAQKSSLERYREIVELNPGDFDSHFQLCNKLMEEKLYGEAVTELEKLLKKNPKNTEIWNLLGWGHLNNGQKDKAFTCWKRSMNIDPKNPDTREQLVRAHLMMGKAFRNKGIFTQALVHFKQLLSLMPKSAEVHLEIAATYDMKGDVRSAAQAYNQVMALDPKNKVAKKALNDLRMKR